MTWPENVAILFKPKRDFTPTLQTSEGFRVPGDGISASLQQGVESRSTLPCRGVARRAKTKG